MDVKALENKVTRLQFQNQRLSEKVEVQKKEINSLESRINQQEERWRDYESTVACINRSWDLLHEDLSYVHSRILGDSGYVIDTEARGDRNAGGDFLDPFLAVLIGSDDETKREIDEHVSKAEAICSTVEKGLKERSKRTQEMLSKILEDLKKSGGGGAGGGDADDLGGLAEKRQAVHRVLLERAKTAEDRLSQVQQELKGVRNELGDAQGELETARRKILSLKQVAKGVKNEQVTAPAVAMPPGFGRNEVQPGKSVETVVKVDNSGEVVKLKQLLEARTAELDKEKESHIKTEKELRTLQLTIKGESWVTDTGLYRQVVEQKSQLLLELEKRRCEIDNLHMSLQKERQISSKKIHNPEARIRSFEALQEAQKRIGELQNQLMMAEQARHESEYELQTERDKLGHQQTVQELKLMVKTLQDEITRKERSFRDRLVREDQIRSAREEAQEAGARWKEAEGKLERLQGDLRDWQDKARVLQDRQNELRDVNDDLKVFVEVLNTFCDDRRSEAEIRASEEKCKRELEGLKSGKKGNGMYMAAQDELKEMREKVEKIKTDYQHVKLELDRLQRTNRVLTEDLDQQKSLNEGLEQEVEATGNAYEDMQSQNTGLLQQLTEKDEAIDQLRGQITRLTQRATQVNYELDAVKEELRSKERDSSELASIRNEFEGKVTEMNTELMQVHDDLRNLKLKAESHQEEVQRKEVQVSEVRMQLETAQKTASDRKRALEEEIEKAMKERNKRQRLEQELKVYTGSSDRFNLSQDERKELQTLERLVETMRRQLNCSVCGTKKKSVILTKCFHTFCNECIRNRLETRNRKCPGCGTAFGQHDVKQFFLT